MQSKDNLKQKVRSAHVRLDDHEKHIDKTKKTVGELAEQVEALNKFMMSNFSYLGDIETKIESFKATLIRKDITTEAEFDELWDEIKGVRVKKAGEKIEAGDFCRITFEGRNKDDGAVVFEEKNFPVRLGSGTLFVDDYLIGQDAGKKEYEFDHSYPEDYEAPMPVAGKTLAFKLSIDKVKTRINSGNAHA